MVISASPVVIALIVAFTTFEDSERYYFLLVYAMINIFIIYLPIVKSQEPPDTEA